MAHAQNRSFSPAVVLLACFIACGPARSGEPLMYYGDAVPPELDSMYVRGLTYLVKTQRQDGAWDGQYGNDPGVVGLAVMAMLAHGDDPNVGPYSEHIRKGLDHILRNQNSQNGYIGSSMYNHGFATLALAEAYGNVTDPRLGPALEKATGLILSAQAKNPRGAWRYSPESTDADTTVSGAQMVALFAARNAGIKVPDKAIEAGVKFYRLSQSGDGGFGYTGAGDSAPARSAIGSLVFALAKMKDGAEFKSAMRYLQQTGFGGGGGQYDFYYLYYAGQAFFHAGGETWENWNKVSTKRLADAQNADGSLSGTHGAIFSTSAGLLALAVNYRFLPIYER